ncbi:hypothetical protein [Mycolicibacter senuensis]|uniref:hypothetical protein n=1 Tax=Mycolicibacter senuensis TaxID=386913 RepID=UPI000DCC35DB|nr:hypothetical protein [Mycolicibacter senuensis]RAU99477.1 hypothetical protein DQP56_10685 [Mycolicibacter senuensis]
MAHPLNLRRDGAKRIPGGDPWPMEYEPIPMSEHQLELWHHTIDHLESKGLTPIVETDVCRALWRRGGPDRVLAVRLHQVVSHV